MKKLIFMAYFLLFAGVWAFTKCSDAPVGTELEKASIANPLAAIDQPKYGEFDTQLELGEHLVLIAGCHDCHTPKIMTPTGPEPDFSLALSGHPADMPAPDVNRAEVEAKGLGVTQTLTAWVGPWGISYAANLTSDPTGIGNWSEENFIRSLREGKLKGSETGRPLLPPMPWQMIGQMTDQELKAIYAYLQSTKPINNVVPAPQPPLSAGVPGH